MMEVMGHFRVCQCKSVSVTAELHASFGTRDQKICLRNLVIINKWESTCKSHEIKHFITLSYWISSSNESHLSRPNGTETLIPFANSILLYEIIERLVDPAM